jgi:hypothetical protein
MSNLGSAPIDISADVQLLARARARRMMATVLVLVVSLLAMFTMLAYNS